MIISEEKRRELSEAAERFVQDVHERGYDSLVFLDKSARPYAALFRARWKTLYAKEKMPDIRFANIGREKVFEIVEQDVREELSKQVRERYDLEGKKVLIFDEYYSTGNTIKNAYSTFRGAFPSSHFDTGVLGCSDRNEMRNYHPSLGPYVTFEPPGISQIGNFGDECVNRDITVRKIRTDKKSLKERRKYLQEIKDKQSLIGKVTDFLMTPLRARKVHFYFDEEGDKWRARTGGVYHSEEMDPRKVINHPHLYREQIDEVISSIDCELNKQGYYRKMRKELEEIGKEKLEKKSLEEVVASIIALPALTLGIIFFSPSLTGNAIANLSTQISNIIGAGLFIVGLIGTYFWFKKR